MVEEKNALIFYGGLKHDQTRYIELERNQNSNRSNTELQIKRTKIVKSRRLPIHITQKYRVDIKICSIYAF